MPTANDHMVRAAAGVGEKVEGFQFLAVAPVGE